ncbi:putative uncharacterized protein DDB_G0286829 [Drosophila busckii]|uniref:putative uncharacterized protein DDB_G0286829 n=1 Tax=Drosophila busckii TaxID=30019 RepID=UPI00083ED67B|nr:putative uncharacterized protein DDB_G0286829 [Drosophila busckii]
MKGFASLLFIVLLANAWRVESCQPPPPPRPRPPKVISNSENNIANNNNVNNKNDVDNENKSNNTNNLVGVNNNPINIVFGSFGAQRRSLAKKHKGLKLKVVLHYK